jgi:glutathione S-transferase
MTSSTPIRLYSGPLSMFGAKAQIAVAEKGLEVELVMVPFDMAQLLRPNTRRCCGSILSVRCRY